MDASCSGVLTPPLWHIDAVRGRPPQRNWGEAIPRCGADLIGYFAPHEGSATTAYGVYSIADLAAYEAYRARLRTDPLGRENYAFAQAERFIRREDRLFLRKVSDPAGGR
ncbi:NIPSNAP family protein [Sphingomonas sp. AR_OL41]|nr:NIPSNAP family protein [Sphingomonas sp. AR_OL41]MDH7975917.1 NIPSNAP family protein [Sphingomonas sp. AR_OL41]